jgi:hypothetical protein
VGSTDVDVTIGPEQSVRVTSDDNLVEFVRTDVRGGELTIERDRNLRTRVKTGVSIVVPAIKAFRLSGSGDVRIHGLNEDAFEIVVIGSGDLEVDGRTDSLSINISGSGDVNADDLRSNATVVRIDGSGDADVYATDSLDVSISGSGGVDYRGDPDDISENVFGSGRIRSR